MITIQHNNYTFYTITYLNGRYIATCEKKRCKYRQCAGVWVNDAQPAQRVTDAALIDTLEEGVRLYQSRADKQNRHRPGRNELDPRPPIIKPRGKPYHKQHGVDRREAEV